MENKFLWLCAFIDVLETLYVGIYQIGSFPLIFLHSYFWGLDVFSLWWIFSIEFKPFVNLWRWNRVYVTKWWEHSQNPQTHCNLRAPRLSQPWARPRARGLRLELATASTPAPHLAQPNVPALGTEAHSGHAEQCQQSKITCVFFLFNDSLMY